MIVEFMQLRFIFQLVGRIGADAVVWFDDNRIARLRDKRQSRFPLRHQMPAGRADSGFFIQRLHLALVFNKGNGLVAHAAGHIEIRAQLSVLHQPVFVIGFDPVDLAIAERKKSAGFIHFLIVFQT